MEELQTRPLHLYSIIKKPDFGFGAIKLNDNLNKKNSLIDKIHLYFFKEDDSVLFLVLTSVVLLNLSQAPYPLTFLRWVALIPILYIFSSKEIPLKNKVLYGYMGGFLFLLWPPSFSSIFLNLTIVPGNTVRVTPGGT